MALGALLVFGQGCTADQREPEKDIKSPKDKLGYSLGYNAGNRMKNAYVELDAAIIVKGFRDGISGNEAAMTDQEMRNLLGLLQKQRAQRRKQLTARNLIEGEIFLAENAAKEGVVTLPSGLQYKIIKEGSGRKPAKTGKVKIHYRGALIDGTEFDSSYKRGQPAAFGVDKVIRGLTEALMIMKEGSKWQLYIPASLAYGEIGVGAKRNTIIAPQAAIIYDLELIAVMENSGKTDSFLPLQKGH